MPIAVFGDKYFEVSGDSISLYTMSDFKYSMKLDVEKQDCPGYKPSSYIKGPDLADLSFNLHLDVANGVNPRTEWQEWESILNASTPYQFILGSQPIGENSFILVGVDPSNFSIDNEGNILAVDLALSFQEYVRAGAEKSSSSSTSSKKKSSKSTGASGLSDTEFASLISDDSEE